MNKSVYLCLFVLILSASCKMKNLKSDPYNLDFEREVSSHDSIPNWVISLNNFRKFRDPTDCISGKFSLSLNTFSDDDPNNRYLYQTLVLPDNAKDIEISFYAKNTSTSEGGSYLKSSLLDSNWNIVAVDSVSIDNTQKWRKYCIKQRNTTNTPLLLTLQFVFFPNNILHLDDVKIKINEKDIYNYACAQDMEYSPHELILPKEKQDQWDDLIGKKIIGIGESVHGQHEIAIARNKLIQHLVEKNNCKLIILEAPDYVGDKLNDFVQGNIAIDSIFTPSDLRLAPYFYINCKEVLDLLKWVKIYNESATTKVFVAGMDVSFKWCFKMKDFLSHLSQKNPDVIHLQDLIYKGDFEALLSYIKNSESILALSIGENNYKKLVELSHKMQPLIVDLKFRDTSVEEELRANNVEELVKEHTSPLETAVVCGHLEHINKSCLDGSYLIPSLGSYLKDYYHDNYYVIAQLVGNGTFQGYQIDTLKRNIKPLEAPVNRSLEKLCEKMNLNDCFVEIKDLPIKNNKIYFVRMQGGRYHCNQFYPQQIQGSIDAITYTEHGTALHLLVELKTGKK